MTIHILDLKLHFLIQIDKLKNLKFKHNLFIQKLYNKNGSIRT